MKPCPWCIGWANSLHRDTLYWRAIHHPHISPHAQLHLLFIPLEHVHDLLDLPPGAHRELWTLLDWARQEWKLSYYGLVIRGGIVADHAHAELIVGDVNDEDGAKVLVEFP